MDVAHVLAAARRVLAATPYGFFTTLGEDGPSARMVGHLSVDEDLTIVFGTGRHTRKVRELRADPTAIYAVADPTTRAAVCLYGEATLDDDASNRRAVWQPALAPYFPSGPEEPELLLVSLRPDRLEVWSRYDEVHPDPLGLSSAVLIRAGGDWVEHAATHPEG